MGDCDGVQPGLDELIEQFTAEVARVARLEALEALEKVLGPEAIAGLRARVASAAAVGRGAAATTPADLGQRVLRYLETHPGCRAEAIGRALSVTVRELSVPLRKLMASGQVRSEGTRRSTIYHASIESEPAAPAEPMAPVRRQRRE